MTTHALVERNHAFYEALWSRTYLTRPQRFNTWPVFSALLPGAGARLEVGPGLRPRLPVAGTHFLDLSPAAVARLKAGRGLAHCGEITALPFLDGAFGLVVACDVLEHVADDGRALAELTRVLQPGGLLVFSVPLHAHRWTEFDACVGHARRYEPAELFARVAEHRLTVERSAVFGMQANNPRALRITVRALTEYRSIAIRLYNWLFFPLGLLLQKPLQWKDGVPSLEGIDEILLLCRKAAA